ncbi:hypothetical protein UPYG_G00295150 [Umbra pygmaea]|uniref:Uncharacterized protein n=1 Tax=Umbra pygmaea TaxID=75934 RepID=A0ABD0W5H3_UMBPY
MSNRGGMEHSSDTFEEDVGMTGPPTLMPVRPVRRPDMYAQESIVPSQPEPLVIQPKTMPREQIPPDSITMSLQCKTETPWEGITLNRCLFIAITILVLSSGFQKLHETVKGGQALDEVKCDDVLRVRRSALSHKDQPHKPETSLSEVLFWWLPDLDDDKGKIKKGHSKNAVRERPLKGLRSRSTPERLVRDRERQKGWRARRRDEEKMKSRRKQAKLTLEDDKEDEIEKEEVKPKNIQKTNKFKNTKP